MKTITKYIWGDIEDSNVFYIYFYNFSNLSPVSVDEMETRVVKWLIM